MSDQECSSADIITAPKSGFASRFRRACNPGYRVPSAPIKPKPVQHSIVSTAEGESFGRGFLIAICLSVMIWTLIGLTAYIILT
ncbi:MAG: hypothetical protein WA070_13175 [Sphingobium sp.]